MIVIFIFLIIGGIFVKQRKKSYDLLIIIFLCLLQYYQQGAPDFESYEKVYNYIGQGATYIDTGLGWMYLCKFGNLLHLNYRQFEVASLFVGLLIIRFLVQKKAGNYKNTPTFYSLYLLFPALLDLVQFRFFLAQVLVLFGICFLYENTKGNYVKFAIIVVVASTIHSASLFYLVFLVIPFFNKIKKYMLPLMTVTTLALFGLKDKLLAFISIFVNETRVVRYLQSTDSVGLYGLMAYIVTLCFFTLILYYASSLCNMKLKNKYQITFVNNVYIMSVMSWIALPLSSFDTNLFRVQRIMWPLLYIVLTIMLNNGIFKIKIFNYSVSVKMVGIALGLFGFVFYILWFTSNVIMAYLV